jgi:AcrR family transcriptional regulator
MTSTTRPNPSREETEDRFLDAAERLLIEIGYSAITTRRLAEEAGANHGLVHYYFGSMEELFVRVLERFTGRLIERQRGMYASPGPYLEKWREAMRYLDEDRPYQKIWYELHAMAWNRSEYRERVAHVLDAWSDAMREAVAGALTAYRLEDGPLNADEWVTLIVAMNEGIILERLSGIDRGHAKLLAAIDRWLEGLEARAGTASPAVVADVAEDRQGAGGGAHSRPIASGRPDGGGGDT